MSITVYTKPNCVQCTRTYKVLQAAGKEFDVVDMSEDPAALTYVKTELGYEAAPVVVLDGLTVTDRNGSPVSHWYGLRPDLLKQL